MSEQNAPPRPLHKQNTWSPDTFREELWLRRKGNHNATRHKRGKSESVTDDDLEELKGCIELGFGFGPDSPDLDPKLSCALPALGFYCSVNKQYSKTLSRSSSESSISSEPNAAAAAAATATSSSIFDPGDDPEMMKTRLRQWAQVVAWSVKQFSGVPN